MSGFLDKRPAEWPVATPLGQSPLALEMALGVFGSGVRVGGKCS